MLYNYCKELYNSYNFPARENIEALFVIRYSDEMTSVLSGKWQLA